MTFYEHAMICINGTLALGLNRRHGWQIVALAGLAANIPDLDGLTILLGPSLYAEGHRLWGHNLLVAGLVAAIVSAVIYQTDAITKSQKWLAEHWKALAITDKQTPRRFSELGLWIVVGVLAAYSHLLMDTMFSVGKNLPVWGVPLFWPFSKTEWAYPLVRWGNIGATVILAISMFLMVRWPTWIRSIALSSLVAVAGYMVVCGILR
ncbi:MAG: metal-dependent hydrolase [Thermoguttaceae bacterium]